jgi:hypothetical protein
MSKEEELAYDGLEILQLQVARLKVMPVEMMALPKRIYPVLATSIAKVDSGL